MLQMALNEPRSCAATIPSAGFDERRGDATAGQLVDLALLDRWAGLLTPPEKAKMAARRDTPVETLARGGLASWQMKRVSDHVQNNLAETIHIDTLAALARLSTSHFCRAFKVSFGETAHGYIMRQRLNHARTLMLTTCESLSGISAACGLADQAHLTRLFRRHMGDTPFNWRRTWRQAA